MAGRKKMKVVKGVSPGCFLEDELAKVLLKYATTDIRREVSEKTGVNFKTVENIITQTNRITKSNRVALKALIQGAMSNCEKISEEADESYWFLEEKSSDL